MLIIKSIQLRSFALRAGAIGVMIGSSVILARTMGKESFGTYSFSLSIISILFIPVHVGLPTLVLRETARGDVSRNYPGIASVWRWSRRQVLKSSICLIAATHLIDALIPGLFPSGFSTASIMAAFMGLVALTSAVIRGLGHVDISVFCGSIARPLLLGIGCLVYTLSTSAQITPLVAMRLHAVAATFAFIGSAFLLNAYFPRSTHPSSASQPQQDSWRITSRTLAMVGGLQVVNQNIGPIVLGATSTEAEVGLLRVATNGSGLLLFGLQIATPHFEPIFARLQFTNDIKGLQIAATRSALAGFLATLPIAIVLFAGGERLLGFLYGSEFTAAYSTLCFLVAGQLAKVYFGSAETILILSGEERRGRLIWIANVLLHTTLTAAVCSRFGAEGAAVAASISAIALRASQWYAVKKTLGVDSALHSAAFTRPNH